MCVECCQQLLPTAAASGCCRCCAVRSWTNCSPCNHPADCTRAHTHTHKRQYLLCLCSWMPPHPQSCQLPPFSTDTCAHKRTHRGGRQLIISGVLEENAKASSRQLLLIVQLRCCRLWCGCLDRVGVCGASHTQASKVYTLRSRLDPNPLWVCISGPYACCSCFCISLRTSTHHS